MAISGIWKLTDDEELAKELIIRILQIPALRGLDWEITSPAVLPEIMDLFREAFHTTDPFRALKQEQNAKGLELYPKLKKLVRESVDPLFTAVNLAIQGNAIDIMIGDQSPNLETTIEEKLRHPISEKPFLIFREKLKRTRRLVYLGDNCGEVVFDKVLIETILSMYSPQIVFVVRGVPALNDVTIREAEMVGMDQLVTVMSNGVKEALPGTILSRCSSEFRDLFQQSDLIISKGVGNFDSLEEEKDHSKDITYMLDSKCLPICRYFKSRMHQPILANAFVSGIV
jgi:uncharacterized protein with ATP-grasp and redox domains